MQFDKPALSIDKLLDLMRSRGLAIQNIGEAAHYLKHIGYYRISGYALPLTCKNSPDPSHKFKPGYSFTDILNIYRFDRELRLLVMDAIERVEVSFRACVSDTMSLKHGPHWFLKKELFVRDKDCEELATKLAAEIGLEIDGKPKEQKGRDVFIEHYLKKYQKPLLPPSWMIAEVLSISSWSRIFQCIKTREDRKSISLHFDLNPEVIQSWIHAISYTRNICAHHARLWNREFTIKPNIAKGHEASLVNNGRFYAQAYVINFLLLKASPESTWWNKMIALLNAHPFIDKAAMGFPQLPPA